MSTLDHITLVVSDYARSKAFYEKALAPLANDRFAASFAACPAAGSSSASHP